MTTPARDAAAACVPKITKKFSAAAPVRSSTGRRFMSRLYIPGSPMYWNDM